MDSRPGCKGRYDEAKPHREYVVYVLMSTVTFSPDCDIF
jgi:hypothetical protein